MTRFRSILFTHPTVGAAPAAPDCLPDLHLDDIIETLSAGDAGGTLRPLYYAWACDVDEVTYRHEVFRDLSSERTRSPVQGFVSDITEMRRQLQAAAKLWHPLQRQGWLLHTMHGYCRALTRLHTDFADAEIASRGLRDLREYLDCYVEDEYFQALSRETEAVRKEMTGIRYSVHIKGLHVDVDHYHNEPDYSEAVGQLFDRFRQDGGRDYLVSIPDYPDMNHVEEQILDRVAALHPEAFRRLAEHCSRHEHFVDETLDLFDREIRFYLAYLTFTDRFTAAGLQFCFPAISAEFAGVYAEDAFDLALAIKRVHDKTPMVCNDFRLSDSERILIVTGPNQGGKTTFARTVGQLAYLAALGCPVPAQCASLMLPDRIFTHFERQERVASLHGKLDDELVRIHNILGEATGRSVIVMNESFSSTTLADALEISTDVLRRIIDIGCVAVYVSFLDELSRLHPACVSMVGGVDPDDPTERTFRFERRPADGLAYAAALADKYGLSPEILVRRVTP